VFRNASEILLISVEGSEQSVSPEFRNNTFVIHYILTLILPTSRIWWATNNASKCRWDL